MSNWTRRWLAIAMVALLLWGGAGCVFRTVAEQQQKIDALCQLWGSVAAERQPRGTLVVVLARFRGGDLRQTSNWSVFDHFVLEQPGRWFFGVSPGTYGLAAFEDRNGDRVYQPGESALRVDERRLIQCQPGTVMHDIALVIPEGGRLRVEGPLDIGALEGRSIHDQMRVSLLSLMVNGDVVTLDDPRFARENANKGLWQPFDFLFDVHAGLYFLGPYDANKVPVLFVHGITGTPTDFRFLIEHLDQRKFQPWVFYYPSGGHLDYVADVLNQLVTQQQARLGFRRLLVVAHSMGGLVARAFVLKHHASSTHADMPLFVSLSSPWGGHAGAELGVKHAPAVVRSWYDMAPDSPFLRSIFFQGEGPDAPRRGLPDSLRHHLLFGFTASESGDGVVSLASQLRPEAQDDATRLHGFTTTHTGILKMPEVSQRLNRLLDEARERQAAE